MVVEGRISQELEVKVPAAEAWKIYGTLQLAEVVAKALPDLIAKIEVVKGDGSPGTLIEIFFVPGTGLTSYKEKYTVVDDEKRVKEAEVVEGGYLDFGFKLYRVRMEVIQKAADESSCVTRASIEYELKDEIEEESAEAVAATQVVSIQPFVQIMHAVARHLLQT